MFAWIDDNVAELRRLWALGESTSVIGAKLGCSRNAVVGKAARIRLPMRKLPTRHVAVRPRCRPLSPELAGKGAVTLLGLTDGMCRYPVGEPQEASFGFCGCIQAEGSSYCTDHHALTHTRTERKLTRKQREQLREAA